MKKILLVIAFVAMFPMVAKSSTLEDVGFTWSGFAVNHLAHVWLDPWDGYYDQRASINAPIIAISVGIIPYLLERNKPGAERNLLFYLSGVATRSLIEIRF